MAAAPVRGGGHFAVSGPFADEYEKGFSNLRRRAAWVVSVLPVPTTKPYGEGQEVFESTVTVMRSRRARVGALSRDRDRTDPVLMAARRDLAAVTLEQRVRDVMAGECRPSEEQCARIAALLQP